jgi:hypothetical protein
MTGMWTYLIKKKTYEKHADLSARKRVGSIPRSNQATKAVLYSIAEIVRFVTAQETAPRYNQRYRS